MDKTDSTTLATIQPPYPADASREAHEATRDAALRLIDDAIGQGCDVLCLPEYLNCVGLDPAGMRDAASDSEDLAVAIRRRASSGGVHILLPMLVRDGTRIVNRSELIEPSGETVLVYDKVHLTIGERTDVGIGAGHDVVVEDVAFGRVGVATCYDLYFPEFFSAIASRMPDVVFFPSLQRSENPDSVLSMLSTRAMDSASYFCRSGYGCGLGEAWFPGRPYGFSCIVHPDGTILANAGHYEGFAMARIPLGVPWRKPRCHGRPAESVRSFLREDRRPGVYG